LRFVADGPDIPDDLLTARDEGRVVFFCGAGVSRARAKLPDFYGLAERVLLELEGSADSPSKRLMAAARRIEEETKIGSLVSADRVFSLLEADFEISDVEAAVARALKPEAGVDLSAHQLIIDLARGPDGRTRLVTTNFELLFENCNPALSAFRPGHLPDPQRPEDLDGVVHLHGIVKADYSAAQGKGFVLSSAAFGSAYISNGWATHFISSILKKYLVVFVGYTADDPPVQYLLEALNREPGSSSGLYAFQSDLHSEAEGRWLRKGVTPIAYDEVDQHKALWDTLQAWAARARHIEGWYDSVIAAARKGPQALPPHERGQVKHVVSTLEGARRFCLAEPPPPAEWLCVFDRAMRFTPPALVYGESDERKTEDLFEVYGLDSDPRPAKGDPDEPIPKREIPPEAWDCFHLTRLDQEGLSPGALAVFSGPASISSQSLVPRLAALGAWLSKVSGQAAAPWWAAGRSGLHPDVQVQIHRQLEQLKGESTPEVRTAWRLLFESWESPPDIARRDWFELRGTIKRDGWSPGVIRRFASAHAPHLKLSRPLFDGKRPPLSAEGLELRNLVSVDVEYPHMEADVAVPEEALREVTRSWRALLERAIVLERESNPYSLELFSSLAPDEPGALGRQYRDGLPVSIFFYRNLLSRLIALDAAAAREEVDSWWKDEDTVFARLRIWASGEAQLYSPEEAAQRLWQLSDRAFWSSGHQRDLLVVLARRWATLPAADRDRLVQRLLGGPPRSSQEETGEVAERRARSILKRLEWLRQKGCELGIDFDKETAAHRAAVPEWQAAFAANAAESRDVRADRVRTNVSFEGLLAIARGDILARARQLSGERERFDEQKDPFAGLVEARPMRALSALRLAGAASPDAQWAWRTFLNVQSRINREGKGKEDPRDRQRRLSQLLAGRLAQLPLPVFVDLLSPATEWLLTAAERYPIQMQHSDPLWAKALAAVATAAEHATPAVRRREPEWATEALNSPAGKLAQALMTDPRKAEGTPGGGFEPNWLKRVEQLIAVAGDTRRHALAIFAYNLKWFYARDPAWTEQHMLCALGDKDDAAALWAGVLWSAQPPNPALYLRLKPALLKLEREAWVTRHSHIEVLAGILLAGWISVDDRGAPLISNDELRTVLISASDEFRAQVLWQIERWSADATWRERIRAFMMDVWPRQKTVKTPKASARLAELAFSDERIFAAIADIVVDRVTTADQAHLMLYDFIEKPDEILAHHAEQTLALLAAVLPNDVRQWPYRIEQVLDRIASAQPALQTDGRLLELRRRWNTR
jgi:hypothetical protein